MFLSFSIAPFAKGGRAQRMRIFAKDRVNDACIFPSAAL